MNETVPGTVSAIVMTLNAEKYIKSMLDMLKRQTRPVGEIIVADSESDDKTVSIAENYDKVKIVTIKRSEFDHGGSRDYALKQSSGDFVLFFTQDAVIGSDDYIENLIANFVDENVAMVCGRQIAKEGAYPYEKLIREFNYPDRHIVRTEADIETMGIKAFYMSDACSAYRRTAYFEIGGFEYPLLTNEDMLIASHAIRGGYKTVYEPKAYVYHSHNYKYRQEFKRNFDVAAFMVMHEKEFEGIDETGEGFSLVKYVSVRLLKKLKIIWFIRFGFICVAKFTGNRKGKKIRSMSMDEILKNTSLPSYWKRNPDALKG